MACIYTVDDSEVSTTKEEIQVFLPYNAKAKITEGKEPWTRGPNKPFKTGNPFDQKEMTYDPDQQPRGTTI
jgi:hypothetical protein